MADYTSFAVPQYPTRPSGFNTGLQQADADFMLRQAQMAGLEGMLTGNQRATAELERYKAMTPMEMDVKGYEAAAARAKNTPGYLESMTAGDVGRNQVASSQGRRAGATEQGDIDKTNAESQIAALTASLQRVRLAGAANPLMGQAEYQKTLSGVPQSVRGLLPAMYTPEAIEGILKVLTETPAHRGAMALETQKEAGAKERTQITANATVEAARVRVQAKIRTLLEQFEAAKTPEQISMYGGMILADPEVPDNVKTQIKVGVDKAERIIAEKIGKGGFDMSNPRAAPGDIAAGIRERLNPGQQQPGAQQRHSMPELRQMYPGKSDQWLKDAYKKRFGYDPL